MNASAGRKTRKARRHRDDFRSLAGDRQQLVLANVGLLAAVGKSLCRKLPKCVDAADLEQAGYFGLVRAAAGFDPTRGVSFRTYAARRTRGEMLDFLRGQDHASRRDRATGRAVKLVSIDADRGRGDRPSTMARELPSKAEPVAADLADLLNHATRWLDGKGRLMVRMYAIDGWTMAEIGWRLGLSESRVSQVLSDAFEAARASLEGEQ